MNHPNLLAFFIVLMSNVVSSVTIYPTSDHDDFTVSCGVDYDCINSTINCPSNASCDVVCNGWDSCSSITTINYIESNPHSFTVNCIGIRKCMNKQIKCPSNSKCEVNCDGGTWACRGITVNGPDQYKLDIYCNDIHEGCELSTIYAQSTSSLYVECGNPSSGCCSCRAITWYLPPNVNNNAIAIFKVDNNFLGYGGTHPQYPMNIYAINGFKDLLFMNYNGTNYGDKYDMHCYPDYSKVCANSRTSWGCYSDGDTTCNAPQNTNTPTTEPTETPTQITLNPSQSPTEPTQTPSQSPTSNTLGPSQAPAANTLTPSQQPTDATFSPFQNPTTNTLSPSVPPTLYSTQSPTLSEMSCNPNTEREQTLQEEINNLNSNIEDLRAIMEKICIGIQDHDTIF